VYRYLKLAAVAVCASSAVLAMSVTPGSAASIGSARHPAPHVVRHDKRRATPHCNASDLSGVLRYLPGAKPSSVARALLILTNKGPHSCSLHGYASFGFLAGDGSLIRASRTSYIRVPKPGRFLVKPRRHAYADVSWKLCGSGGANGSGGEWTGGVVFTAPGDTHQVNLAEENYKERYGRVCTFNFTATALRPNLTVAVPRHSTHR
jgi:hypothetical protein